MDSGRSIELEQQSTVLRPRRHAVVEYFSLWLNRARQRRQLAALDDRLLADIGIGRCEVMRECDKRFWED